MEDFGFGKDHEDAPLKKRRIMSLIQHELIYRSVLGQIVPNYFPQLPKAANRMNLQNPGGAQWDTNAEDDPEIYEGRRM